MSEPYCRNVVPPRSYCETVYGTGASNEAFVWVGVQVSLIPRFHAFTFFFVVNVFGDGSKRTVVSTAVTAARTCVRISLLSLPQNQLLDILDL